MRIREDREDCQDSENSEVREDSEPAGDHDCDDVDDVDKQIASMTLPRPGTRHWPSPPGRCHPHRTS